MKITVSINLGGSSFNIDDDAYAELKDYLKRLEFHLAPEESSAEILSDIEMRMAELLRTSLTPYKQVITIDDVRRVISIMGTPQDFSGEESSSPESERIYSTGYHRMYRDPDHRIIGGVCAGMGAYWHVDPIIVRIIFLALIIAGGLGVLIYLILYIVLPEARTTAQKIEMKGRPVNIHNITDAVKKEFNSVRKNMKF
ncbi:MAG TPA: PspC domain-containing protein [Bacteroidales bacterium]|nr:PspC domain-containing protein [Bacteroidales bacterium]